MDPTILITAKVAMGVIWDWTKSNTFQEHWQSICGQMQVKGFLLIKTL
jgi:hypothetical protein